MRIVSPVSNTAFSLTWSAAMQIYYFLEQKKVFTQDWFRPFLHSGDPSYRYSLKTWVENMIAVIVIKFSNFLATLDQVSFLVFT